MSVYEGIRNYNEYTAEFKEDTIEAMTKLNLLLHNLGKDKPPELAFAKAIARYDWHKAYEGSDYCDEPSFQDTHPEFYTECGRATIR